MSERRSRDGMLRQQLMDIQSRFAESSECCIDDGEFLADGMNECDFNPFSIIIQKYDALIAARSL